MAIWNFPTPFFASKNRYRKVSGVISYLTPTDFRTWGSKNIFSAENKNSLRIFFSQNFAPSEISEK
jgi:hypothetical protein